MAKRSYYLLCLFVLLTILISAPVQAKNRPIQLALVTPIQLFPEDYSITGVRLNLLYGRNVSVTGLDVGMVNHTTTGSFKGLQYGLVGLADSEFLGWQDWRSECCQSSVRRTAVGFRQLRREYEWAPTGLGELCQEHEGPADRIGKHH